MAQSLLYQTFLIVAVLSFVHTQDFEDSGNRTSKNLAIIRRCRQAINEVYSACGNNNCQNTCANPNAAVGCTGACTPGCVCVAGFIRNSANVCVLPSLCGTTTTGTCTGANQVYSLCGNDGCQRSCSRLDVSACAPVCTTPACLCNAGYVRDANNACILPTACPATTTCGTNEILSSCGNDGCQRSCTRLVVTTCIPACNIPACICATGFVRDSTGACVLPSTCPATTACGANEVYSTCGNDGCQRSCTRLDVTTCIPVCSIPACVCVTGYVRNAANACVLPTACPATSPCGTNEVFSNCGNDGCQRSCTRLDVTNPLCIPVCSIPACICVTGFVRNAANACVLPSGCPTTVCTTNQMLSACGDDGCQPTCARPTIPNCIPVCTSPRCICTSSAMLGPLGNCVTTCPNNPVCTGAFEMYTSMGNNQCQKTCANMSPPTACTNQVAGCICQTNYFRNSQGVCVAAADCSTCPTGETSKTCGANVCENDCANPTLSSDSVLCNTSGACVTKCFCNAGLVRSPNGGCIAPTSCPM